MEIIKPRTDEQLRVTCPHCGAVIGYRKTEIREHWLPGGRSIYTTRLPRLAYRYVKCPSCEKDIMMEG